ncbi:MAG: DUF932 domain-containing protein [Bryobacterales bacterium]|nr:DUF932 domain-containing protein [Bryobacterales bacterium]
MALEGVRDEEETLNTWDDVKYFARGKDLSVRLWPCTPRMCVSEDKFIQTEDRERVYVSDRGWSKLCSVLGCDYRTIKRIGSPGLATKVLNDAWNQDRERMSSHRIVVDGWTVVGVVGSRYQPYGHGRLVEGIEQIVLGRRDNGWSGVGTGWREIQQRKKPIGRSVGTELRIVLPRKKHQHSTDVQGPGGKAKDVSWVGIEARNGLGGECAVSFRTTIFRLICANGLVRPAADYSRRVTHTGDQSKLHDRVRELLGVADKDVIAGVKWLDSLGNREFDARAIAADRESVALLKRVLQDIELGPTWIRRLATANEEDRAETLRWMANGLAGSRSGEVWRSGYRENQTLWDFVNIFTEAAQHSGSLQKQLRIEERAGRLADRLLKLRPSSERHAP